MTQNRNAFALDKSARVVDADGRLHVARSHISKANVCDYYGQEIPDYEALGLEPTRVYKLYRDPAELEAGAATFARLPILSKHVPVTVDDPQPDLVIGSIGSDVAFNTPYLDADLCFWDKTAIAAIDTDTIRELSCCYRYAPDMTPGTTPDGVAYDGRMAQIKGNHLALVEAGRAGSDVYVADSNPFKNQRTEEMKMTKLGKALVVALGLASPKLAQDSALAGLVGMAKRDLDKKAVKAKLTAMDAEIDPQKLDDILDAIIGVEDNPEPQKLPSEGAAGDADTPADKIKALLAGKVDEETLASVLGCVQPVAASDEDKEDADKIGKPAMDAAIGKLRADLRAAEDAREAVRPLLGRVASDSAAEIYGLALDHLKVDRAGVSDPVALGKLFAVAVAGKSDKAAPVVAQDSAGLETMFPGVQRFGRA